jgi:hypothetical protein
MAAARLVHLVRTQHPNESFSYFTGSMLSRRLGMFDDGLALAQQAYQLEPSWHNAVGVANVQGHGRTDDCIAWPARRSATTRPTCRHTWTSATP